MIKTIVRGAYDIQKLRIQMGNRIVSNFKAKLGQAAGMPESELGDDERKLLDKLRLHYRKITVERFFAWILSGDDDEAWS